MKLTEHFILEEFTRSQTAARLGIDNNPSLAVIDNLKRLAEFLEMIRLEVSPIVISSGYRSPDVNKAIGGAANSQHVKGCAADFTVPGMTPDQVIKKILASDIDFQFDQLIREFDSWVHISIPNEGKARKQVLIIDSKGPRDYA